VAPLFNNFNRIDSPSWDESDQQTPGRQIQRRGRRLLRREGINRQRVRVVVVIIGFNPDTILRSQVSNRSNEEMRVHNARVGMAMVISLGVIGTLMDVLKRRDQECQQKCQTCLNCQRATHH
jgi:hypothetical protein